MYNNLGVLDSINDRFYVFVNFKEGKTIYCLNKYVYIIEIVDLIRSLGILVENILGGPK